METGIRELKDNLSRYIRRVEAGERIGVTAHGRVYRALHGIEKRYGVRSPAGSSPGRAARRSNSSAVIRAGLALLHGGMSRRRPYGVLDLTDNQYARLVRRPRREFDPIRVRPQRPRLNTVDAVLVPVGNGLQRVELERPEGCAFYREHANIPAPPLSLKDSAPCPGGEIARY